MDADWSVELAADDPALEFPWSSPDGTQQFVDLSQRPEAIATLPEVALYPELAKFLTVLNGTLSPWLTVKCDAWIDDDLGEAEAIYDAQLKMCSYIDLVRRDASERFSFERHEKWLKLAASGLQAVGTDDPIACEFIVRRCWYQSNSPRDDEPVPGLYITIYVFGYGNDEAGARAMWEEGLAYIAGVLLDLRA